VLLLGPVFLPVSYFLSFVSLIQGSWTFCSSFTNKEKGTKEILMSTERNNSKMPVVG